MQEIRIHGPKKIGRSPFQRFCYAAKRVRPGSSILADGVKASEVFASAVKGVNNTIYSSKAILSVRGSREAKHWIWSALGILAEIDTGICST